METRKMQKRSVLRSPGLSSRGQRPWPGSGVSGSALVLSLMALTLLSIFGVSALHLASMEYAIAGNYRKQAQAFSVAEAGLDFSIARIRQTILWRGDEPGSAPVGASGSLDSGAFSGTYTVRMSDNSDNGAGLFDPLVPQDHVRVASAGTVKNATQQVECLVRLTPDDGSKADSPYVAVVTQGANTGSGLHTVNGYDNDGNLVSGEGPGSMVCTFCDDFPESINEDALKAFADVSLTDLTGAIPGQAGFWRDAPLNTRPWIVHVSGNIRVSGNITLYGIIFVEGTVVLSGSVRVKGVIYAPNVRMTSPLEINGGGNPWDAPVMGQVIAGPGGVDAAGNHADVQLVSEYVDVFNNYAGPIVNVDVVQGSWRQY